jgi:hypothetical protein
MSARAPAATAKVEASSVALDTRSPLETRFCTPVASAAFDRRNFWASNAPWLLLMVVMSRHSSSADERDVVAFPADALLGAAGKPS